MCGNLSVLREPYVPIYVCELNLVGMTCTSSSWEAEREKSQIQGLPSLQSKFKAILISFVKFYSQNKKKDDLGYWVLDEYTLSMDYVQFSVMKRMNRGKGPGFQTGIFFVTHLEPTVKSRSSFNRCFGHFF